MPVPKILDPACGSKMFYFDKEDPRVLFGDIRQIENHEYYPSRYLNITPDVCLDYRNLPFNDGLFKVVIFDPPHLIRAGDKSWLAQKYGKLHKDNWEENIRDGFAECFRLLEDYGVLIFKWSEVQIPVSQILALTDISPPDWTPCGQTNEYTLDCVY